MFPTSCVQISPTSTAVRVAFSNASADVAIDGMGRRVDGGRSVIRSVGHSVIRSVGHSLGHSVGRTLSHSVGRTLGHSVGRTLGHSVGRTLRHSVIRSDTRSFVRSPTRPRSRARVDDSTSSRHRVTSDGLANALDVEHQSHVMWTSTSTSTFACFRSTPRGAIARDRRARTNRRIKIFAPRTSLARDRESAIAKWNDRVRARRREASRGEKRRHNARQTH